MGVLVSFTPPAPTARAVADGQSAAILFFTGVRYVRLNDVAPCLDAATAEPAKPARKRRRGPRARAGAADQLAQA